MKPPEDKDYVQSLERGLSVILAFADRRPLLTLAQLAEVTGLPARPYGGWCSRWSDSGTCGPRGGRSR